MKNAGSSVVAIILGAAGLAAASAWTPAHADPSATARAVGKTAKTAKANKTPAKAAKTAKPAAPAAAPAAPGSDHCALDDLGYDQMLAKKSDAPAPAPAVKGKAAVDTIAKSKAAADKLELDLGKRTRDSLRPTDDTEVKMTAKTLSSSAVADVVEARLGDLEYCFMKIPEADRASQEFTLHLSISAKGAVVSSSVDGDEDAATIDACVQAQVKRWTFPQADAPTEIDYPLALHVQHIDN